MPMFLATHYLKVTEDNGDVRQVPVMFLGIEHSIGRYCYQDGNGDHYRLSLDTVEKFISKI